MEARIYQPTRTAMQSGLANTRKWRLEFAREQAREIDSLMGWTGSSDMNAQVQLSFETRAAAIAFAEKHGLAYRVIEPRKQTVRRRPYADNFRYGQVR